MITTCRSGVHQYERSPKGCPECKKIKMAAWQKSHRDRRSQHSAKWARKNPERIRVMNANWHEANREREKIRLAKRYRENTDRENARTRAWAKANPEARREYQHRRRARTRGSNCEPITLEHLKLLFDSQDGCCRYCHQPLGDDKHLDHRVPLSRGGAHAPSNVCWACPSCNLRKRTRTEQEFLAAA